MSGNLPLWPAGEKGWSAGLGNMLGKESARWWNLRSVLIQALLWLVILNGLVAFVIFLMPLDPTVEAGELNGEPVTMGDISHEKLAEMGISTFFVLASFAVSIGAVILCHDSVLKEQEAGTAAWILSKPVSRQSFVLSKLIANSIGILGLIVLLQGAIAYAQCSLRQGAPVDVLPFLAGLAVLGLCCLFYGFLAIAAGALLNSRAAALGLPLLVLLGGEVVNGLLPIGLVLPCDLGEAAGSLAARGVLQPVALLSIAATILWIAVFVGAILWKFERVEL